MTSLPVLANHAASRAASTDSRASNEGQPASISPEVSGAFSRALANAIQGEVRFSLHDRMLYATDASLYQVEPMGVVIPRDIDDGVRAVSVCHKFGVPMLPRGGGTSLAGQCTNRAVVIDWSGACAGFRDLDIAEKTVYSEPGVTVDDLNDAITGTGLFFAPDPATSRHATIGGCIGNNAAGARSVLYGRTSENVVSLDACLADGTRVRFAAASGRNDPRVATITAGVVDVVKRHEALIRERFPKTVRRNAGYGLDMIVQQLDAGVDARDVNLTPMLCGSEGTLAVTLGAVLMLRDRPKVKALAVLGFGDLDDAIAMVEPILATKPSAVEMLDDIILDLARANTEYRKYAELMPMPPAGRELKAVLYVEFFGANADEINERIGALRGVVEKTSTLRSGAPTIHIHHDAQAMTSAWKLRKAGEPLLHGIPGNRKPITFIEDNAIPVPRLGEFVTRLRAIVAARGTFASFWAHASVGVLHIRPLLDIHDHADREKMRAIALEAADLARELGGVMSGEHGDGRVRGPLLERFYGPELMDAFREIKRIFDPRDLLNPGNIVDLSGHNPRPVASMAQSLRVEPTPGRPVTFARDITTYYDYDDQHGFDAAVEMCNGSGVCRKRQGGVMCPSYMATLDERHSTRGRGNALRLAITGQLGDQLHASAGQPSWNDPDTIQTLDLCLSCKACKTECPSNVDIARLKAEYTAQRYKHGGAPFAARIMGNIRTLNRLGAMMPGLANWGNRFGPFRAVLNAMLGLHPKRSMPAFSRSLARVWDDGTANRPNRQAASAVVLFGDCFTMYNESSIGLDVKRVYEAFGYSVVLADAGCCGRAKMSLGLLEDAIKECDATLARLRPFIEDNAVSAILVAEPACLSAIKDDWLSLKLAAPKALREQAAKKCFLPEEFLHKHWDAHPSRPTFRAPLGPVLLHGHCHQKALWGIATSADMLRRAAGDQLRVLDTTCCGMSGSFGYSRDRYDLSMKIGELALFPAVRDCAKATGDAGDAGACVAAPGTSCRHQIHDGTGAQAQHPMSLLASWLAG